MALLQLRDLGQLDDIVALFATLVATPMKREEQEDGVMMVW